MSLFEQSVFPSTANRRRAATRLAINIDDLEMTTHPDVVLELGASWTSDTEIIVEVCSIYGYIGSYTDSKVGQALETRNSAPHNSWSASFGNAWRRVQISAHIQAGGLHCEIYDLPLVLNIVLIDLYRLTSSPGIF